MSSKSGGHNKVTLQGHKNGSPETIDVVNDGTYDRLAVDAAISGVTSADLDENTDGVGVFGGVDGAETENAATRQIINVDAVGRVRTDSTLQVADADVSTSNPVPVAGTVDHDAADSGKPLKIGGRATAGVPTDVTNLDRVNAWFDPSGALIVGGSDGTNAQPVKTNSGGNLDIVSTAGVAVVGPAANGAAVSGNPVRIAGKDGSTTRDIAVGANGAVAVQPGPASGSRSEVISRVYRATTTKTDAAIITVSAGTRIYITRLSATLDEAATVGVGFRIGFGATTVPTEPTDGNTADGVVAGHPGMVPGSIMVIGDGTGVIAAGADGEDLRITISETPTDLRVYVSYFTAA
jgi:hypothetical protein